MYTTCTAEVVLSSHKNSSIVHRDVDKITRFYVLEREFA